MGTLLRSSNAEGMVDVRVADFNGADALFNRGAARAEWVDLAALLEEAPLCLQASEQRGKIGSAIFDPKATNARLTEGARRRGWTAPVPVPAELTMFGVDWDTGKRRVLAEWQFSNYPFLWNNIIRSEAVFKGGVRLPGLLPIRGLVVITKTGIIPASNSTLYFEQAAAQIEAVLRFNTFELPIRLVGLDIAEENETAHVVWTTYAERYARDAQDVEELTLGITRGRRNKYGGRPVRFLLE